MHCNRSYMCIAYTLANSYIISNCTVNNIRAHCYALQCRRIDCEQLRSSIDQQLIAGRFGHEDLRELRTVFQLAYIKWHSTVYTMATRNLRCEVCS